MFETMREYDTLVSITAMAKFWASLVKLAQELLCIPDNLGRFLNWLEAMLMHRFQDRPVDRPRKAATTQWIPWKADVI